MIYDTLNHVRAYKGLSKNLDRALDFLAGYTPDAPGRIEIDGENVYATLSRPLFRELDDGRWEAHRRYIDIHVDYADGEAIGVKPLTAVDSWEAYDEAKDCMLSSESGEGTLVRMAKDSFLITFPWDAHKPLLGSGEGKKLVVKVLCDLEDAQ